jgi:Glycosyl transferases group 1
MVDGRTMKILFVDHSFHSKTRSSHFFVDLLAARFDVQLLYIDPADREAMVKLAAASQFDLIVLWQMDFLAPLMLARGVPTVVVPMFDGSSLMPDLHWLWMRQARVVNFARRLHDRVGYLGCKSKLVKFYLPAVVERKRAQFDGLKVMLWQRRPEEGINLGMVERLFGSQLDAVHIHDAPDNPKFDTANYLRPGLGSYELTVTRWFENRSGFDDLLSRHNVLIAPRRAEGIGMVMLEGLARGMLVVASDAPTHDEYISNWINGVLFNPDYVEFANFSHAPEIGEMAWRSSVEGHARWQAGELDLVDFVVQTPKPEPVTDIDLNALGRSLVRSYLAGLDVYRSFLLTNVGLIERMSGQSFLGKVDEAGRFNPDGEPVVRDVMRRRELPWLDQNRLSTKDLAVSRHIIEGSTRELEGHAWMLGQSLTLGFRLDPQLGATQRLRLHYALPPNTELGVSYCIVLNGNTLGIAALTEYNGCVELAVPSHAMKRENFLQITVDSSRFAFGLGEPVSLGIKRLEFI